MIIKCHGLRVGLIQCYAPGLNKKNKNLKNLKRQKQTNKQAKILNCVILMTGDNYPYNDFLFPCFLEQNMRGRLSGPQT